MIFAFEEEKAKRREYQWPEIRRGWFIILALLVQLVAIPAISNPDALVLKKAILGATTVLLVWSLLPNLRWWSFRILGIGLLLNTIVMVANGGLMPATFDELQHVLPAENARQYGLGQTPVGSKNILLAEEDVNLKFLSDLTPVMWPVPKVYSVGDFFLFTGFLIFIFELFIRVSRMKRPRELEAPVAHVATGMTKQEG